MSRRLRARQSSALQDCVGSFSWAQARAPLDGLPEGGINIAYEAIDRHVLAGRGGKLAVRWIGRDDAVRDFTYVGLRADQWGGRCRESMLESSSASKAAGYGKSPGR